MQLSLFELSPIDSSIVAGDQVEIYLPTFYQWMTAMMVDLDQRIKSLNRLRMIEGADTEGEITRLKQLQIEKKKLYGLVDSFYQPRKVIKVDKPWVWLDGVMIPVDCVKRVESTDDFFKRVLGHAK